MRHTIEIEKLRKRIRELQGKNEDYDDSTEGRNHQYCYGYNDAMELIIAILYHTEEKGE